MAEKEKIEPCAIPRVSFRSEDYMAIWIGLFLLFVGMLIFFPNPPADLDSKIAKNVAIIEKEKDRAPFKTVAAYEAEDALAKLRARDVEPGKTISSYLVTTSRWKDNPIQAFYLSEEEAKQRAEKVKPKREAAEAKKKEAKQKAIEAEAKAAESNFADPALNEAAKKAIEEWRAIKVPSLPKAHNHITKYLVLLIGFTILLGISIVIMGKSFTDFIKGFPIVFILTLIAYTIGNQEDMRALGFSYVLWAIIIGLIIANTVGTPKWLLPAAQTEFYIKTGLVLLGAEILFGKIILIGIPGIFVTWVVTPIVLIVTYIFGQKVLKMPSKELNITVSSDMSVSGVSAAIATACACGAKKEELTLAVGLSMAFTSIMIFAMPAFIKFLGMPDWWDGMGLVVAGSWIGGTIDNTGSVVAAGEMLGPVAMYTAATIKMIQNIMIGVIAFGVAAYWALKVIPQRTGTAGQVDLSFGAAMREIWARFPRFILGFLAASIIFSLIFQFKGMEWGAAMVEEGVLKGWADGIRGWLFGLAFVSIGLSTNFRELAKYFKGGKPVILYVCGQSFNILMTVTMAILMFIYIFPNITKRIMGM